ncbi:hypothetical protein BDQ12DRAFT_736773 [Crucibulum laeve]|uniref:NADAR domain-containing protein n=1 Tax=Crucibulum laeve TaxID=68775 RepID=A0A5C3LVW6_9AGAR|nr:hypothetical protein BDQ12DRAFT_736773 [Crucibulum laeve]
MSYFGHVQGWAPHTNVQYHHSQQTISSVLNISGSRRVQNIRQRIFFYDKGAPHYAFTNFSPHPVQYQGKIYPTSEHLFQSLKFEHNPKLVEIIRSCPHPRDAFNQAKSLQNSVRDDWKRVKISKMDEILLLKFTQHPALLNELLATGDAELVEDSPVDAFWGIGINGNGRNELGKSLERVRAQLSTQQMGEARAFNFPPQPTMQSGHSKFGPTSSSRVVAFHHRHGPLSEFSNSSPYSVSYRGLEYPTSEHLYQAMKFLDHRPGIAEYIRTCSDSRASRARDISEQYKTDVRADWPNINVRMMDEVLFHKFTQHRNLKYNLLSTGTASIIAIQSDSFWGIGPDEQGRNELGKALERIRAKI